MTAAKFSRKTRNAVARASEGGPSLGTFLDRVRAVNDPLLTEAIEGIWCGRCGDVRIDLTGSKSMLCIGWYNSRVEWSYIS